MSIKTIIREGVHSLEKKSPYILTMIATTGVIATSVMTGRATIKACDILEKEKKCRGNADICWKDKIKLCWKPYISPFLMGAATIFCIIEANNVSSKRNAAIATAYSLAETTLKDYQEKVIEEIGEKKEEKVRDKVVEKHISENPPIENEIIVTDCGDTLFFDMISGRYFKHDIESVRRIINEINHDVIDIAWVSLNDFYYALGLPYAKIADDIGWTSDRLLEVDFTSKLTDKLVPCVALDYDVVPKWR